ncbi:MAG: hypothetical protein ABIV39_10070, partial [Verrucomicrobiota bacterium]
ECRLARACFIASQPAICARKFSVSSIVFKRSDNFRVDHPLTLSSETNRCQNSSVEGARAVVIRILQAKRENQRRF